MRKLTYLLIATLLFSCSVPNRFIVSELGYEPKEYQQSLIYTLPKTTLNVQVDYKRDLFIPGPYADYAGKMLGITGVRKDRDESYAISAVHIDRKTEPDFGACYSVAAVEGDISGDFIAGLQAKGLIWNGSYTGADSYFSEDVSATAVEDVLYKDVTMEPNEEVHTKTIYKTIQPPKKT